MSRLGRHTHGGVVLLRATDVVGEVRGRRQAIDLGRRIPHRGPCATAVHRDHAAPVVAVDHAQWILGIDPQVVMVGAWVSGTLSRVRPPSVERMSRKLRMYSVLRSTGSASRRWK